MAMPPPVVQGGSLHGAAEALQEEVKEAQRESGAGLTVGRRLNRKPDRWGRWLQAVLPCRICNRKSCMVVTGVSTRSRHAVYPISRHTARMASGCSSVAHSPVKRCRMVVMFGTIG